MDDIEIVIKISEKEYNGIKEDNSGMFGGHIYQAIKNGRKLLDYLSNYHERPYTVTDFADRCRECGKVKMSNDCVSRSDIGLTDFEIVMCDGNYKQALEMLLTKIEKAPSVIPKSDWIPVTERFPEDYGPYLVTIKDELRGGLHAIVCKYVPSNIFPHWERPDVDGPIIAWKPLSKPYKESGEK